MYMDINGEIGQHLISMPAAAVRLAQNLFTQLSDCHCLLVGVGEMIQLSAKQLQNAGVSQLTITNRTETKAAALAQEAGARTLPLEQLATHLENFDVIISATGANRPLITPEMVEPALKSRRHAPIFMVDLAVPRDIHPEVGRLRDIYLYSLDDLQNIVSENLDQRKFAAAVPYLRKAAAGQPDDFWLRYEIGRALQRAGRNDEALIEYEQALLRERRPEALVAIGAMHLLGGREHEAQARFREALVIDPQNPEAHINLALIDMLNGDYDKTIKRLRQMLERHASPQAQKLLAETQRRQRAN